MDCRCRWVPGTMDQVTVSTAGMAGQFSLGEVMIVLGPSAVNDLYLKGRAQVQLSSPLAWPLMRRHDARYLASLFPDRPR